MGIPIDLYGDEIEDMTEMFVRTTSPAAAWHAYSICRQTSRPVPDVVQAEIDRFAATISKAVRTAVVIEVDRGTHITLGRKKNHREKPYTVPPVKFRDKEIYEAWRGGFGSNPIGSLQDEWRDYAIANAVDRLIESGTPVGNACDIVADQESVSVGAEMVKKIWSRHR